MSRMRRFFLGSSFLMGTVFSFGADQSALDAPMRQTFHALINLQPFALTPERFRDPANRDIIKQDLKVIVNLPHRFPGKVVKGDAAMQPMLRVFSTYAKDMEDEFNQGSYEYVRHRVHTVTAFCLTCHTRTTVSADFEDVGRRVEGLQVTAFQKAEFYAATRQFDKALSSFKLLLDEKPKDELGVLDFTRALRHALSISVRVKQDPKWTLALLNRLDKRKDLPVFDMDFIRSWKKDTEFWMKDPVVSGDLTSEALLRKATQLVERAQKLQSFSSDESGDVSYLRASSYFNEALQRDPKAAYRGEALYGLGMTYRILREPYLWELDSLYFEACIREYPHTAVAKKCFRRYSERATQESQDAGPSEPALKLLGELRALSE